MMEKEAGSETSDTISTLTWLNSREDLIEYSQLEDYICSPL
jgi:hypothetical protein